MKILQVGVGWYKDVPGGANRYFRDLCHALNQQGLEQRLIFGSEQKELDTEGLVGESFDPTLSQIRRYQAVQQATASVLKDFRPDVVAGHFGLYSLPVLSMCKSVPFVVHFHGPWALESHAESESLGAVAGKYLLEQLVYRRATKFICLSEAFGEVLAKKYSLSKDRIHVVPGGADLGRFSPQFSQIEARRILGWKDDARILVTVRRLRDRMGLENLIESASIIRQRCKNFLLKIVGTGPRATALQSLIEARGLGDFVQLVGYVRDDLLPAVYRAADASIVPTIAWEGFGLVVVESLACGTPVFATDVGGLPEILRPFRADMIVRKSDPTELADHVVPFLAQERPMPTAEECRAYVEKRFRWETIGKEIAGIYQSAIDGR